MDSILDVAVSLKDGLFDEGHLKVHYRSRHEDLIRFSNHHFYKNKLLTFPSPGDREKYKGVTDVYLPNARYEVGARVNRHEADRVVEIVFDHMRNRPEETIGVVALSRSQADLIEELVDFRRFKERDLGKQFSPSAPYPFFVKNLERVQGDERDHMVVSIGYGPIGEGDSVPNRFGPINRAGGEKRLNVAITRAKNRLTVVHSLHPSQISSQAQGALLLKRFLEYVSNPLTLGFETVADEVGEPESPFEVAVKQALEERGHRVVAQVGVAGYRIDLAICSEDLPGIMDLGIECDGFTYHSTPAARDRDWLRESVLVELGWVIHRVWSTSWARDPELEISRIEEALSRARSRKAIVHEAAKVEPIESNLPTQDLSEQATVPGGSQEVVSTAAVAFEKYAVAEIPVNSSESPLQLASFETLIGLVEEVVEVEGPVHMDQVIERLRICYGLGKVKGSTRSHVEDVIKSAVDRDRFLSDGQFLWKTKEQLEGNVRRAGPRQDIYHINDTELMSALETTEELMYGGTKEEIIVETTRQLGYKRTGTRIRKRLGELFGRLTKKREQ